MINTDVSAQSTRLALPGLTGVAVSGSQPVLSAATSATSQSTDSITNPTAIAR